MKLRELFVEIGVDVDPVPLEQFDRGVIALERNLKYLTVGILGATGAAAGLGYLLNTAGGYEQVEIAFETMLGGAKKAKALLSDLFEFARKTPFEVKGMLDHTRMLLGMGIESKNMIETMTFLGNVAAGLSVPLGRLALNYGQVKAQTKLTGRELRDFAIAGVPLLSELAKQLNKSEQEILKMISAGDIGFEHVRQTFKSMTSEGGRFHNLMQRQSLTLFGIINNIKDSIYIISKDVGGTLLPRSKALANEALKYLEVNKKIITQKLDKYITSLIKGSNFLFKILRSSWGIVRDIINSLGGLERVLTTIIGLMFTLFGIQILTAIGNIAIGITGITKALLTMGTTAQMASLKAAALPLLIGVAVAAIGLAIEDVIAYFQGKNSLTGVIIEAFEKKYPNAFEATKKKIEEIKDTIRSLKPVVEGYFNNLKGIVSAIVRDSEKNIKLLAAASKQLFKIDVDGLEKALNKVENLISETVNRILQIPGLEKVGAILKVLGGDLLKKLPTREQINQGIYFSLPVIAKMMLPPLPQGPTQAAVDGGGTGPTVSITVNNTTHVPEGTPTEQIGPFIGASIQNVLEKVFNDTSKATRPRRYF